MANECCWKSAKIRLSGMSVSTRLPTMSISLSFLSKKMSMMMRTPAEVNAIVKLVGGSSSEHSSSYLSSFTHPVRCV